MRVPIREHPLPWQAETVLVEEVLFVPVFFVTILLCSFRHLSKLELKATRTLIDRPSVVLEFADDHAWWAKIGTRRRTIQQVYETSSPKRIEREKNCTCSCQNCR